MTFETILSNECTELRKKLLNHLWKIISVKLGLMIHTKMINTGISNELKYCEVLLTIKKTKYYFNFKMLLLC